jgi:hypothetical protein
MLARASRNSKSRSKQQRRRLAMEALESRRVLAALPFGAFEQDLGEFMLGSVAVTPVLLESNGQLDPSSEDWTETQIADVLDNIEVGLDWWVDTLANQTSIQQLSFTIDPIYASTPVETKYEPISRRSNDYTLYVGEFLSKEGFSTGNLEVDARAFNQAQREKLDTDWSFTIFVVPSVNDDDGEFAAGGSFSRAFAFAGGLFMIIPSTRPASTYTHETGHIFWARDEYAGGGSYSQRRGYYNTLNENAANNPSPGFVQQPSIMAAGELLASAYADHTSPASTLAMLGWQDSDGDGIFDVLDVPHRLEGTGYYDVDSGDYRFIGSATVQTLPNMNSSGLRNDITINRIRDIEYRFDGGEWQLYSSPNAYEVDLDLTISVPSTAAEIEIRARDNQTTVTSNVFSGRLSRADATLVPGINGFVWVDSNQNGLRDVGEYGPEDWTVELVSGDGSPLELRKTVEPDDFPDGVLSSGFSPHLTLTSVGTDVDGRIGVFADSGTSTGSKNFRGFSRGSQTFLSTWTTASRRLQATFSVPTSVVQIDAVGASNNSYGRLEAFNSQGELIGRYTTGRLSSGQVETMTIARGAADIAYVIMGGHANSNVKLDNLQFGPEATTKTNALGQYALPSVPDGSYIVRVTPSGSFRPLEPSGGTQSATVIARQATEDVDFGFESGSSQWQNPRDANDVNDDGIISALDALLIINELNANGARDLRQSPPPSQPYIDVSGESIVSALDALLVINFINNNVGGGSGEGSSDNRLYCGAGQAQKAAVASQSVLQLEASQASRLMIGPELPAAARLGAADLALRDSLFEMEDAWMDSEAKRRMQVDES